MARYWKDLPELEQEMIRDDIRTWREIRNRIDWEYQHYSMDRNEYNSWWSELNP